MQARFSEQVISYATGQSNATKVGIYSVTFSYISNFYLQAYLQEYDQEKKLNENFNNFVQNFQLAYWGPNTAQHQIHSTYDTIASESYTDGCMNLIEYATFAGYSEYIDGAEFQEKGDEWLPLGLKYQKHVECFVRYNNIILSVVQ